MLEEGGEALEACVLHSGESCACVCCAWQTMRNVCRWGAKKPLFRDGGLKQKVERSMFWRRDEWWTWSRGECWEWL